MPTARRTEPLQAVVNDATGVVDNVIVCDQATATMLMEWGAFPGSTLHDCTGLPVGVGWTYAGARSPAFRPPAPGPDWTWNDDTDAWDAPPPPPEPEPEPTPDPDPALPASADPDPAPTDPAPTDPADGGGADGSPPAGD